MKRPALSLLLCAIAAVGAVNLSGQGPEKPSQGFLSALKVGQSVTMKEVVGHFEVSTFDDGLTPLGHKVIEIGPDLVAVEDIGGLIETRIPVYSIKSIVRLKVPQK